MKSALQTAWIVGATIAATLGLLSSAPFESASRLLDYWFGGAPEWTQVEKLLTDPHTQEVTHGESPSSSLTALGRYWANCAPATKVVLIGNSQMFYVSLAPGESAPKNVEETYPDIVAEHYNGSEKTLLYRLAAPGMSYTEALWYLNYLALTPQLRPNAVVLQLNYQSFWNGGIRDGMLAMLGEPAFLDTVKKIARQHEPYSDDFADALHRYTSKREELRISREGATKHAFQGPAIANGFESAVRSVLASVPSWNEHSRQRTDFYDLLYRVRVYVLHIKPSTARSITGARLWRSEAALNAIASICRDNQIRLFLFSAPVNPQVSLYRTASDLKQYHEFTSRFGAVHDTPVYDLESAIPATYWGTWMGGPDPLHLGRRGHHMMAGLIVNWLDSALHKR